LKIGPLLVVEIPGDLETVHWTRVLIPTVRERGFDAAFSNLLLHLLPCPVGFAVNSSPRPTQLQPKLASTENCAEKVPKTAIKLMRKNR